MSSPSELSILDHISLRSVDEDAFETILPAFQHNHWPLPFGGGMLAAALSASSHTVAEESRRLFSLTGSYLGGSQPGKLRLKVTRLRDSRTFSTRSILVTQLIKNNERAVCVVLADYIEASHDAGFKVANYNIPPRMPLDDFDSLVDRQTFIQRAAHEGRFSQKAAKQWNALAEPWTRIFSMRPFSSNAAAEVCFGLSPETPGSQDQLPTERKYGGEWFQLRLDNEAKRERLNQRRDVLTISKKAAMEAAIVWACDGGTAEMPLYATKGNLSEVEAIYGLDFAYRILANEIDFDVWNAVQWTLIGAANGRTVSEARIYAPDGKLLVDCTMSGLFRQHKL